MRIKLQKFDGSENWKSWWAHFQNCAVYNDWTKRDKLAFMKCALTGNAAQVLWDTDASTTGSFRKLLTMLKSRYSGERQAEKYRAELQIRRRKPHESLSALHHDIRRLMALAYPKLTADAREEIACDHFTNALSDSEFALKVKKRAPTSLDEALRVALRLEAWAKSTKMTETHDERNDRAKPKIRAAGNQDKPKVSLLESTDRITKVKTDVAKMYSNMDRQYEELKRLIMSNQQTPRPQLNTTERNELAQTQPAAPNSQNSQRQALVSAGEQPVQTNVLTIREGHAKQQRRPPARTQLTCYSCGMPGQFFTRLPEQKHGEPTDRRRGSKPWFTENEGCSSCIHPSDAAGKGSSMLGG